jgi:hypothetical protein
LRVRVEGCAVPVRVLEGEIVGLVTGVLIVALLVIPLVGAVPSGSAGCGGRTVLGIVRRAVILGPTVRVIMGMEVEVIAV